MVSLGPQSQQQDQSRAPDSQPGPSLIDCFSSMPCHPSRFTLDTTEAQRHAVMCPGSHFYKQKSNPDAQVLAEGLKTPSPAPAVEGNHHDPGWQLQMQVILLCVDLYPIPRDRWERSALCVSGPHLPLPTVFLDSLLSPVPAQLATGNCSKR